VLHLLFLAFQVKEPEMKKLNKKGFLLAIDIMINSWNTKVKVKEFLRKKKSYIEES
jgi:predicted enzyme involved in methoxymalonyl-ACP biosynthesis